MIKEKHSHIDADEMQHFYLGIEEKHAKENKGLNTVLTALFFVFIFAFAVIFWILPDKDVSEAENRALASAPELSFESLANGSFTKDFASYMADQFPARGFFVNLKAVSEAALLKGENNGVIFAKNGYLVKRFDTVDEDTLKENIKYICDFAEYAKKEGIDVTVAAAGRTADVAHSVLPQIYGTDSSDNTWKIIDSVFSENGIEYTDLKTPLATLFDEGEYVYYKTDHHWTSYGAYSAYRVICDKMGIEPAEITSFRRETVSDSFYGTTWSSAGAGWIDPDTVEFFRFDGDDELTTDRGDESFEGLYKDSFLYEKDKYSAFLGGNAARIDITSGREREKLLVVKDSFFHSVAPFFAKDFDVTALDLRYYTGSVADVFREEGFDRILILMNVETLGEESGLRRIKMGIS